MEDPTEKTSDVHDPSDTDPRDPVVPNNLQDDALDSTQDTTVLLAPTVPPEVGVLYHRRFYVLLLFALTGFIQNAIWNTWGPLTESADIAFGWSDSTIALLANWGPIAYIVSAPFFSWLMDVKGMRWATLLTIGLVTTGAGLRCITSSTPAVTWLAHVGQLLNGLGGPVSMGGPPLLSALWFPAKQRTTATGLATAIAVLGIAASFIIAPLVVPQQHDCVNVSTTASPLSTEPSALTTIYHSELSTQEHCNTSVTKTEVTEGIMHLMYMEFGFSALIFLLVLIYYPSRPPTPPSLTATVQRVEFKSGLKELLCHRKFWMMGIPYALSTGVFSTWGSVLAMNVEVINVSEKEAGMLGFWSCVAGQVSAVTISVFADVFSRRIRIFLLAIYGIGAAMYLCFALLCSSIIPYSTVVLYVTNLVGAMCLSGAIPLFYEVVCESTYPIAEGVTTVLLTWLNNLAGLIFLFVVMIPIGTTWMNWCLFGSVLVCTPVFWLYKERYGRLDRDLPGPRNAGIQNNPDPGVDSVGEEQRQ